MAKYKLSDVAPIQQGSVQSSEKYWLLNLDMVESNTGRVLDYLYVSEDKIGSSTITFDTGNVLYSKLRPYLNKVVLPEQSGYATSEMLPMRPNQEIITREYLTYFLRSPRFVNYVNEKVTGAKMPRANIADLKAVEVECPPIAEQKRISALFDKTINLIGLRKQQLQQLEELVKLRFVEEFGIIGQNRKDWPIAKIRDVVREVRYGTSRPAVEGGKYPYLRMNNITYDGELDLSEIKYIDIPEEELEKCTVRKGDVLFNRTNSKELVGKTCVYDREEPMVLAGFVIRVRVNERMLPDFLSEFMNTSFMKATLLGMCKTAIGQANINAQELQDIEIYVPPIELQTQFSVFRNKVNNLKFVVQKSIDETQLLFDSLMQKYFS
jgi:type I restriction enzyme S subunit